MIENTSELRFYGSGQNIWYNATPNGGVWNGYVHTNVYGGDPSVVKLGATNYLMVYVGPSYLTNMQDHETNASGVLISPNPSKDYIMVSTPTDVEGLSFTITDIRGRIMISDVFKDKANKINLANLHDGMYLLNVIGRSSHPVPFMKQ